MNTKQIITTFAILMITILCASAFVSVPTITDGIGFQYENIIIGDDRIQIGDTNITKEATFVVAASDSLHKEGADFICTGADDQIVINAALGTGNREIVLMAGNYSVDRTNDYYAIGVSSHTTLTLEKGAIITLANGQNASIIANKDCRGIGNTDITICGGILDGNKNNQTSFTPPGDDLPDKTNNGIYLQKCTHSTIEDVTIRNTRYHGIMLREACCNNLIKQCQIHDWSVNDAGYFTTSAIVVFYNSDGNIITENDVYMTDDRGDWATSLRGLYLSANSDHNQITHNMIHNVYYGMKHQMAGCDYTICNHNTIYDCVSFGIWSLGTAATSSSHCEYNNNNVKNCSNGIGLNYHNNSEINDNIIDITGNWGVGLKTTDSNEILISDNIITTFNFKIIDIYSSTGVTITNNRGDEKIRLYDETDDVIIIGNDCTGMDIIGTDHIIRDNKGYVTENSGTATLVSGTTVKTITHGLVVTPAAGDIMVTLMESLGSASFIWIDGYTATTFNVTVNTDPTQDVDIAWSGIVL